VAWGLLGALFIAHVVFDGLLTYPSDWDTLAYHVPLVDHWIREGTLYVPNCAFWYSPGNNELLGLWFVAPFSGDLLISLNNLPAVILMPVAAIELVASVGVSRPLCHLAGMAIMATEVTWRQMVSAGNDLAVAGLFLATLVYGIRYARSGKRADVVFASIAFGLLTGVKYYALGYAGVAGLGVILLVAAARGRRVCVRAAAIGLAGALVLGGYWYARNAWASGTPLYPKGFTESTDVWGKIRPDSPTSTLIGSGRPEVWPLLVEAVASRGGPCQLVAVFALPLTLPWLAVSALRGRIRGPFSGREKTKVLLGNLWARCAHLVGRLSGAVRTGRETRPTVVAVPQETLTPALSQKEREGSGDRSLGDRRLRGWLVLLILLSALVFLRTPNVVETVPGTMNMLRWQYHPVRFSLCFLSLAVVGLAVVMDDVARFFACRSRLPSGTYFRTRLWGTVRRTIGVLRFAGCRASLYVIYGLWIVGVGYQVVSHSREDAALDHVLLAANVFMAGALLVFLATSSIRWERCVAGAVGLCALGLAVWGCHWLADRWHRDFTRHYDDTYFHASVLSALAPLDPSRERICVCDDRYYPFFGSRRQLNMCRPLWLPDFEQLRDYLLSREATLLIARNHDASPRRRYANVKQWIVEHPELFPPFHEDAKFTIVRVDRERLEAWRGSSEIEQKATETTETKESKVRTSGPSSVPSVYSCSIPGWAH